MAGFGNEALTADTLTLDASGVAANLDDPGDAARDLQRRRRARRASSRPTRRRRPRWATPSASASPGCGMPGEPVQLAELRLAGKALELALAGHGRRTSIFDGGVAASRRARSRRSPASRAAT